MNECKIVEDLLPLYAEDLVSEESCAFVREHAAVCERCGKLLARCSGPEMVEEENAKVYKKALRKNVINMTCRIAIVALLSFMVLLFGATKWFDYLQWWNGRAPVEQVVKAPVGNGEVTLVDWEASGWEIGGTDNVGTILWMRTMAVREEENGTRYSLGESGATEPWENVQIHWAPNGVPFLVTADLLEGGTGIFVYDHKSWYDEEGGHHSESKFLPSTLGNGFVDVLTALCKDRPDFPTGWKTIELNFYQWNGDNETITFVYETDNGHRGLLDFHYPSETITDID